MNQEYTAVIKNEDDYWIGWIAEIPGVNCQELTRNELIESLKVTLKEAIEFNKMDAFVIAGSNFSEVKIAV
jgi:predicted RNase H-like HicB family nuclease